MVKKYKGVGNLKILNGEFQTNFLKLKYIK